MAPLFAVAAASGLPAGSVVEVDPDYLFLVAILTF